MKWVLCGKNDAAVASLDFLVDHGDEVWAVGVTGDDGQDGWQRSFRAAAQRHGVPYDAPRRINAPEFVDRLRDFAADALISIQYDQILRDNLFDSIGCPCLNLHFALLPRHRGVAPIAWAVLEGDDEAGVTLHHMIEDIDAGDVIAQKAVAIEVADTARQVYDKVSGAAVDLFRSSYPFPKELVETRLNQTSAAACYHRNGDFDFSVRRVDWSRPAGDLHRWIRAMIFPPMQYPEVEVNGRLLAVTRIAPETGEMTTVGAGLVVGRSDRGIDVATADRSICITDVLDQGRPDVASDELLRSIAVGDRLA
jgi:methionyl-tRNA formyltransferase